MNLTAYLRYVSLILAFSALVIGCALAGYGSWALLTALLGSLGTLSLDKWLRNQGTMLYLGLAGATGFGMMIGLKPLAMLIALVAALSFWDLDAFHQRLCQVETGDLTQALEKAHLKRLLSVLGIGFALALAGILGHVHLGMGWAILLGLGAILSIQLGLNIYQQRNFP